MENKSSLTFFKFLKKLFFALSPIHHYVISGDSMLPTLHSGDRVIINRLSYIIQQPKVKDIIVVKSPIDGRVIIKRIAEIKNGNIFVLGDNSRKSTDSRKFGMLERSAIIGKVIYP